MLTRATNQLIDHMFTETNRQNSTVHFPPFYSNPDYLIPDTILTFLVDMNSHPGNSEDFDSTYRNLQQKIGQLNSPEFKLGQFHFQRV